MLITKRGKRISAKILQDLHINYGSVLAQFGRRDSGLTNPAGRRFDSRPQSPPNSSSHFTSYYTLISDFLYAIKKPVPHRDSD